MGYRAKVLVDAAFYRVLIASDDKTLAGTKYLWLYPKENLPERHKDRFATLRGGDLKTARALAIKESRRDFWSYKRWGWAEKHWKRWYFWATQPVIDAAHTLKRREAGLMSYFAHRVSNAGAELKQSYLGDPGVSTRVPQPGALQACNLVPPRRSPTLPRYPMTRATH